MGDLIDGVLTCTLAYWLEHGPRLVLSGAVKAVRLADMRPASGQWLEANGDPGPWEVDRSIFRHLSGRVGTAVSLVMGEQGASRVADRFIQYGTEEDAFADLSRACLAWARSQGEAANA